MPPEMRLSHDYLALSGRSKTDSEGPELVKAASMEKPGTAEQKHTHPTIPEKLLATRPEMLPATRRGPRLPKRYRNVCTTIVEQAPRAEIRPHSQQNWVLLANIWPTFGAVDQSLSDNWSMLARLGQTSTTIGRCVKFGFGVPIGQTNI